MKNEKTTLSFQSDTMQATRILAQCERRTKEIMAKGGTVTVKLSAYVRQAVDERLLKDEGAARVATKKQSPLEQATRAKFLLVDGTPVVPKMFTQKMLERANIVFADSVLIKDRYGYLTKTEEK